MRKDVERIIQLQDYRLSLKNKAINIKNFSMSYIFITFFKKYEFR